MQGARFTNRMDRKQAVRLWTDCRVMTDMKLPSIVDADELRNMVFALLVNKYGVFLGPDVADATVAGVLCILKVEETLREAIHYWRITQKHGLDRKRESIESICELLDIVRWVVGEIDEIPGVAFGEYVVPSNNESDPTEKIILLKTIFAMYQQSIVPRPHSEAGDVPSVAECEYVSPVNVDNGELDDENIKFDQCIKEKKKHTRGDITQRDAAELCAVIIRQIQKWENNKNTPDGFPGRSNAFAFRAWAESYKSGKRLKQAAVAMNRATSVDPKIIEARCSVSGFAEDADGQDDRTLDDLIEEQRKDQAETGRRIKQV